jgi:ABC-type branched-subunit amino acid transport system permease subunit
VASTIYWQMTLGIVLIALVLTLPGGIVGTLTKLSAKVKIMRRKDAVT